MAERVERFLPQKADMVPAGDVVPGTGSWVRYSDYEKELAKCEEAGEAEGQRADRAEAQRDQARQEVLEEVAKRIEAEADAALKKVEACLDSDEAVRARGLEDAAAVMRNDAALCRSLAATPDPSGEQGEEKCGCDLFQWPNHRSGCEAPARVRLTDDHAGEGKETPELEAAARGAVEAIDAMFDFLAKSGLFEEGGGLPLYEQSKSLADARVKLAEALGTPATDTSEQGEEESEEGWPWPAEITLARHPNSGQGSLKGPAGERLQLVDHPDRYLAEAKEPWPTRRYVPATDTSKEVQSGVELIAAERERQVGGEGWTPEHDDEHDEGELALAAACYAATRHLPRKQGHVTGETGVAPLLWPWEREWWKPYAEDHADDEVRRLTKAGALIAAEIDRLLRASSKEVQGE